MVSNLADSIAKKAKDAEPTEVLTAIEAVVANIDQTMNIVAVSVAPLVLDASTVSTPQQKATEGQGPTEAPTMSPAQKEEVFVLV